MSHSQQNLISVIIKIYGLALDDRQVEATLITWFQKYESAWILKAIVESLYRGRYKLVSVDNILKDWDRIGKPRYQFTPEYEREILQKLPTGDDSLVSESGQLVGDTASATDVSIAAASTESVGVESYYVFMPADRAVALTSQHLNPEESAPFHYHHDFVAVAQHSPPPSAPSNDPNAMVSKERNYTSRSMVPSSGILPAKSHTEDRRHQLEPERQAARPAKRRLFHTLKAIVDPGNHYAVVAEESISLLPQSLGHNVFGRISPY
jgi:hypothetical protein